MLIYVILMLKRHSNQTDSMIVSLDSIIETHRANMKKLNRTILISHIKVIKNPFQLLNTFFFFCITHLHEAAPIVDQRKEKKCSKM